MFEKDSRIPGQSFGEPVSDLQGQISFTDVLYHPSKDSVQVASMYYTYLIMKSIKVITGT